MDATSDSPHELMRGIGRIELLNEVSGADSDRTTKNKSFPKQLSSTVVSFLALQDTFGGALYQNNGVELVSLVVIFGHKTGVWGCVQKLLPTMWVFSLVALTRVP